MENGEVMLSKQKDVDQSGYSEKKLAQNTDLQAGQWLDLKKGASKTVKPSQKTSVQSQQHKNIQQVTSDKSGVVKEMLKKTSEHQKLMEEYGTLQDYYSKDAERLLQKIFTIQSTLKTLLQSLKRSS